MCASCVAQGAVYAGGALTALQVLRARARRRSGVRPPRPTLAVSPTGVGSRSPGPGSATGSSG